MKWIGLILIFIGLLSCNKPQRDYGQLSIQTKDTNILPLYVKIQTTDIGEVHVTSEYDCDQPIELIAPHTYNIVVYGDSFEFNKHVFVDMNNCKTLEMIK